MCCAIYGAAGQGRTDTGNVVLRMWTTDADEVFLQRVIEEGGGASPLPIDSLITLAALRRFSANLRKPSEPWRRWSKSDLPTRMGRRGRTYTLAAGVYQAEGGKAAYIRQLGFSNLQHEQMVLNYVREHGAIRRADVLELCRISEGQGKDLLKRMKNADLLVLEGAGRTSTYRLGPQG